MKSYKPSYVLSSLFTCIAWTLYVIIAMIPLLIIEDKKEVWLEVITGIILILPITVFVICLTINLISKCFTKVDVSMDDKMDIILFY